MTQDATSRPVALGPSPHLTWLELACHDPDRTPYPLAWRDDRAFILAAVFEALRARCGGHPITIGSAYRTPRWNRKKGGAPKTPTRQGSFHLQGRALDLYPPLAHAGPGLAALQAFHAEAEALARAHARIGGIGLYRWGVHLDTRARRAGRLVVWNQVTLGSRMHDT